MTEVTVCFQRPRTNTVHYRRRNFKFQVYAILRMAEIHYVLANLLGVMQLAFHYRAYTQSRRQPTKICFDCIRF